MLSQNSHSCSCKEPADTFPKLGEAFEVAPARNQQKIPQNSERFKVVPVRNQLNISQNSVRLEVVPGRNQQKFVQTRRGLRMFL